MAPSSDLVARQVYYGDGDGWWYYSETAFIIKWVVTAVIVLALILFFVGGYFHAQRRMKKGLPPLRYHRVSFDIHSLLYLQLLFYVLTITVNSGLFLVANASVSSLLDKDRITTMHHMAMAQPCR